MNAADFVDEIDHDVVIQEQRVVAVVSGGYSDGHQECRRDLLHRYTFALDFGRKNRECQANLGLCLYGCQINISTELKSNVDGERAVVRAAREEIQHPVQAYQLLLDRLRDGFFEVL